MHPFGVTIPATVPQGSEIPEGLMNNPVCILVYIYIYIYIYIYGPTKKSRQGTIIVVS